MQHTQQQKRNPTKHRKANNTAKNPKPNTKSTQKKKETPKTNPPSTAFIQFETLILPNSVCHSNNSLFLFKIPKEKLSCSDKNINSKYSELPLYPMVGK